MKKIFKVTYEGSEPSKPEEVYYVASDFADLVDAFSYDEARKVICVSLGPSVQVL